MTTFEKGDRVLYRGDPEDPYYHKPFTGRKGTIKKIGEGKYPYTVRFDFDKREWPAMASELEKLEGK